MSTNDIKARLIDLVCDSKSNWCRGDCDTENGEICCECRKIVDNLITNGVILPPCNVGDTFWEPYIRNNEIVECKVSSLTQKSNGTWKIRLTNQQHKGVFEITPEQINEIVYRTYEQAEQKLNKH